MKPRSALFVTAMVLLGSATWPARAEAALTSSEKGQIRDFVASARANDAGRVRALVARTDLTAEESSSALEDAVAPVSFTEARAAFLREMVFGPASAASRPLLAQAATRAALGRADAVLQRYAGGLEREARAATELAAIYAFLDSAIANAGRPTLTAHDSAAGISAAAYTDCSKALRDHLERNARWLKGDGVVSESVGRVRAQAQVALVDMMPDGVTHRVDAADALGLTGARRKMLTEWGVLLQDAGKLDENEASRVRDALVRMPGARVDVSVLYAGADRGPLRARGQVAFVGGTSVEASPFGSEVAPTTVDVALSSVLQDLAVLAVKRALDNRGELRLQAERDAAAAKGDPGRVLGRPRAPSVEHVVGAAAHLLLLDAPRTVDLAFARALAGRPESAAILSDAIGALAAFPITPGKGAGHAGLSLELGKGTGAAAMSAIRLAPSGVALGFTMGGHSWAIERARNTSAVTAITRDGQAVALAHLVTVPAPLRDASSWSEAGLTFTKLRGTPRATIAPSPEQGGAPTVKMEGSGLKGFDAIVTAPPADDFVLEGDLLVGGAAGGLALRASRGTEALRGAILVVTPGGSAALVASDDAGRETPLAAPIQPAPPMPVHVKITVKGTKLVAIVGTTKLEASLPATLARGEIGLVAKRGANVDLAGFSLKKN